MEKGRFIRGTFTECINKLWGLIDAEQCSFPDFDIAVNVSDDFKDASVWFGCKDLAREFDCNTISVMFAFFGGGGVCAMEIQDGDEYEKKEFIDMIKNSVDTCGYYLGDDEPVVIELR